ncbi:MAG: ribonuclease HII [Candidatus Micrarchaeota archaeon]|nr:ribonuclease HII [Candidatus Micrarchaeota archaeon]
MSNFLIGLDEAGKGPVIGPLIVCVSICDRQHEKSLKKYCKKDSKQLSAKQREETLVELNKFCTFKVIELTAADLNTHMKTMSLNDIEARAMASLLKNLTGDIMIDLLDRYEWTFRARMEKFGIKRFEAQHKADENFPIVAAASINAKVLRDLRVKEIIEATGIDFGSGYPSDPKTISVLKNAELQKKLKPYIRERWRTLENIKQKKLFEDEI